MTRDCILCRSGVLIHFEKSYVVQMKFSCKYTTRDFGAWRILQYRYIRLNITLPDAEILFICESIAASRDAPPGTEGTPQRHRKISQGVKPFDILCPLAHISG